MACAKITCKYLTNSNAKAKKLEKYLNQPTTTTNNPPPPTHHHQPTTTNPPPSTYKIIK
ncbi:MAG: hypothetical protein IPH11_08715 [Ignavibacteriales bacterium]|nr:hypothetical protein [Ignavibacteriales bacterium]